MSCDADARADTHPRLECAGRVATIALRDPERRNALDAGALSALRAAIGEAACRADPSRRDGERVDVLCLRGAGAWFCSGFDLAGCAEEPRRVAELLAGLSDCVRALRALDVPVVARVEGGALAGGCALLTGCDFIVVAPDAQLGYPVHRIGISPAVSAPSLASRMGPAARALLLSNDLIDGRAALSAGLATHLATDPGTEALDAEVARLIGRLLTKGPNALRETKRWIRRVEKLGSGETGPGAKRDDRSFEAARDASLELAGEVEFATMLRAFWESRARRGA